MKVHIEGMGVNGCLLAHQLRRVGIDFTWHDIDVPKTAWKASTGAIYPSGSLKFGPDQKCYDVWSAWFNELQYAPWLERSNWVYCTKKPPHEARYEFREVAGLKIGMAPSFHLNAQVMVPSTRLTFEAGQRKGRVDADLTVVSHGFGERLGHAYWGWHRPVRLRYPTEFDVGGLRPAIYLRPNRVEMAYAYPIPGTDMWYAGSSIIKQKYGSFKSLETWPKYERWKRTFEKYSKGVVEIEAAGDCVEGWRPATAPEDTAWLRRKGNVVTLRPLWNSGIRHFPFQWATLAVQLGVMKDDAKR